MELLFIILAGIVLGAIARYTFRHRDNHGVALLPAVGGSVAAVLWVALTWAGLKWDGGWIWVVTIVGTALVCAIVAPAVGSVRVRLDRERLVQLRKA